MITTIALAIAAFCLAMCQFFSLKLIRSQSERVRRLEHFIYPEWAEERGFSYTVIKHHGVKR